MVGSPLEQLEARIEGDKRSRKWARRYAAVLGSVAMLALGGETAATAVLIERAGGGAGLFIFTGVVGGLLGLATMTAVQTAGNATGDIEGIQYALNKLGDQTPAEPQHPAVSPYLTEPTRPPDDSGWRRPM